jgi:hypothetical protein
MLIMIIKLINYGNAGGHCQIDDNLSKSLPTRALGAARAETQQPFPRHDNYASAEMHGKGTGHSSM